MILLPMLTNASLGVTMDDISADDAKASLGVTVTMNIINIQYCSFEGQALSPLRDRELMFFLYQDSPGCQC